MSSSPQQFSLRWNNYLTHITSAFDSLRSQEDLVDVTLSVEGRKIRAHKVLLSACSSYFKDIFRENPCQHPVIIFKNVKYEDLAAIIEFMYQGEVNVVQESLPSFLHTAELLSVQGLTENVTKEKDLYVNDTISLEKKTTIFNVLPKILPMTTTATTTFPTTINTNTIIDSTEMLPSTSESSSVYNESPPVAKKSRLTRNARTHLIKDITSNELYNKTIETFGNEQSNDLEFIHTDMKIEIPEFIEIPESNDAVLPITNDEQQQTTEQNLQDETTYETTENKLKYDGEMETNLLQNPEMNNQEMDNVEMTRIFNNQTSSDMSRAQEKIKNSFNVNVGILKLLLFTFNIDNNEPCNQNILNKTVNRFMQRTSERSKRKKQKRSSRE